MLHGIKGALGSNHLEGGVVREITCGIAALEERDYISTWTWCQVWMPEVGCQMLVSLDGQGRDVTREYQQPTAKQMERTKQVIGRDGQFRWCYPRGFIYLGLSLCLRSGDEP
jgi:hypothetical protein